MEKENFKRKIGILGGTFNPIHNGHLLLAETALKTENLESVLLMPSGRSYLKSHMQVLDRTKRYEMVKLAVSDKPHLTACDMEIKRPGNTYTHETLTQLEAEFPDTTFYFIVGADNLFSIENWKKPEEIFSKCILLVAVRNNTDTDCLLEKAEELNNRFSADIRLLPFENTPISSTEIRNRIAHGESISKLVPGQVETYIRENDLYIQKQSNE